MTAAPAPWPSLAAADWRDTYATLHMWSQVVGKVRLALSPYVNHWWGVALYVTARGLTTSPMPCGDDTFEITFDFIDHQLLIDTSRGERRRLPLVAQSVADFYHAVMQALADLGIDVRIWPMPVEVPSPIRFTEDRVHAAYDAAAATAWWRALVAVDSVLKEFRGEFIGKSSPVHFWWGAFDLAVTRFSGRRAPERPGADAIMREGYSHEVMSAGFWPGRGAMPEPAFYAYAAPEPGGFKAARIGPPAAFYSAELSEFLLKYEDVRRAASPRSALLEFLRSAYEAAATHGAWNRAELERPRAGGNQ